jgi:hypothetical protein
MTNTLWKPSQTTQELHSLLSQFDAKIEQEMADAFWPMFEERLKLGLHPKESSIHFCDGKITITHRREKYQASCNWPKTIAFLRSYAQSTAKILVALRQQYNLDKENHHVQMTRKFEKYEEEKRQKRAEYDRMYGNVRSDMRNHALVKSESQQLDPEFAAEQRIRLEYRKKHNIADYVTGDATTFYMQKKLTVEDAEFVKNYLHALSVIANIADAIQSGNAEFQIDNHEGNLFKNLAVFIQTKTVENYNAPRSEPLKLANSTRYYHGIDHETFHDVNGYTLTSKRCYLALIDAGTVFNSEHKSVGVAFTQAVCDDILDAFGGLKSHVNPRVNVNSPAPNVTSLAPTTYTSQSSRYEQSRSQPRIGQQYDFEQEFESCSSEKEYSYSRRSGFS